MERENGQRNCQIKLKPHLAEEKTFEKEKIQNKREIQISRERDDPTNNKRENNREKSTNCDTKREKRNE